MGAAVRFVNLQITDLVDDPPSPAYLLLLICLLPLLNFFAPAAWKCLERTGIIPPMEDTVQIGSSQVAAAAQRDMLIFPTKTGGTEERTLTGKTAAQLKDMCRDYGCAVSGNKTQLQNRLRQYSEKFCNDPASCNLAPVKRRSHKGPRNGPKKTQPKQSAIRRAAIIDTERVTDRSKDTRTADEMNELLRWADCTVARLAYKAPEPEVMQALSVPQASSQSHGSDRSLHDRMEMIESQLAAITAASSFAGTNPILAQTFTSAAPLATHPMAPTDYVIYDHMSGSTRSSHPAYNENISFNIPANMDWSPNSHTLHIGATTPASTIQVPIPDVSTISSCIPTPALDPNVRTRSVKLGQNITITLTIDEIKKISVPATSFAEDIDRLNQMWDDTSPHWKDDSVVKINAYSIALIYWPEIFKKTGLWSAHKSNWTEWKFLVEHYRQGTPEEFWMTFRTSDGSKMSYTAICASLRNSRKNADEELAKRAQLEYGEEFAEKFSYRCSRTNEKVVMSKASAIAKEYRRIHSL